MFQNIKNKINYFLNSSNNNEKEEKQPISTSLEKNLVLLKEMFPNSSDLNSRKVDLGKTKVLILSCEGLVDRQTISIALINPLMRANSEQEYSSKELCEYIMSQSAMSMEQILIYDFNELFLKFMSGFAIVLIEGQAVGFALGFQGYSYRSVSEPTNEVNELGSKEAFTEPIRINLSMIRRRIKSPKLIFEMSQVGNKSNTDICIIYLSDKVSPKLLSDIKNKLKKVNTDIILDSTYLRPFLEKNPFSLFSSIGNTERPDVLCGKINEGRIAILVDGSPYALILPYLFNENFKSFDDYAHRPYFSTFVRLLKYFSFYISFLLPGTYVAITTFHPELLPRDLLFNIAGSENSIPFSLTVEALFIYLVFEILREAGIRLPNAVGHTIGIVGALVIGDAAVNAGLISAPMVMVVAITAICAFCVPQLYEPVMILRFLFIVIGGSFGVFGVSLFGILVSSIICSMTSMHIPVSSPISPFDYRWFSDSIIFAGIKNLSGKPLKIQNIAGSEIKNEGENIN